MPDIYEFANYAMHLRPMQCRNFGLRNVGLEGDEARYQKLIPEDELDLKVDIQLIRGACASQMDMCKRFLSSRLRADEWSPKCFSSRNDLAEARNPLQLHFELSLRFDIDQIFQEGA